MYNTQQDLYEGKEGEAQGRPENKMGVVPVNRLLLGMSLPVMASMLIQALYNIVDSIWVAQINEKALTAVSLAFSMQVLMVALGIGTAVGINAVLSRALGEKNYDKVNSSANHSLILIVVYFLIFVIVGIFAVDAFYRGQTSDAEIITYGREYLSVICCCSFGMFMQLILEKLLQSTGRTVCTMITQGLGAVINLILDPIMIFGWLGCPAMGIRGAAIATVIGQTIAGLLALCFNLWINDDIKFKFKGFRFDLQIMKQIYAVGIPSILIQVGGSIMVYAMNQILSIFSSTATAVFGVYFKLQSFIFMPVFGLNSGMMPIIAYNFGARKKERMIRAVQLSVIYATVIMILGFLAFQIMPGILLGLFSASDNMIEIGTPALRIISISFLCAGFNIICGAMFGGMGNGVYSMIIATTRQLVVLIPIAFLLSLPGKVEYVWWAFPIAELIALVLTVIFICRINERVIKRMDSQQEA